MESLVFFGKPEPHHENLLADVDAPELVGRPKLPVHGLDWRG
jgi:hypothetical protein